MKKSYYCNHIYTLPIGLSLIMTEISHTKSILFECYKNNIPSFKLLQYKILNKIK